MAGRPKGIPKTGGRKKGSGNKFTSDVKEMVLTALSRVGGVEYLEKQAVANPVAFLSLVGKLLPRDITHSNDPDKPVPAPVIKIYRDGK